MPTISGYRRRGYTPESIRNFANNGGVAKREIIIEITRLENSIREDLNKKAMRVMSVLHPIKVEIINYPENQVEELDAVNNPEDETMGKRKVPFSRELLIDAHDFQENPNRKFHRLSPGKEVRLRYAYIIKCEEVIKDSDGNIEKLLCSYDVDTKSGSGKSDKKVKGVIHWVSAKHAVNAEVRLYERLFNVPNPDGDKEVDFIEHINPNSLEVLTNSMVEPSLKNAKPGDRFQFERLGYYCVDIKDSSEEKLVFNRTATLRDTWAKIEKQFK
jgi:glutaminyl-tRNA synthetase